MTLLLRIMFVGMPLLMALFWYHVLTLGRRPRPRWFVQASHWVTFGWDWD